MEVALRLSGRPLGLFNGIGQDPANSEGIVRWGALPFWTQTNSLGLRGKELSLAKPPGTTRIAAIGDSTTYGLLVDADACYPYYLEEVLNARGAKVETINAGVPGISIGWEFKMLRDRAIKLNPDVVLLTFFPNDISDIVDQSRRFLLTGDPRSPVVGFIRDSVKYLLFRTATGETILDIGLRAGSRTYRAYSKKGEPVDRSELTDARYEISGGSNYEANLEIMRKAHAVTNGDMALREPWSEQAQTLVDNYLFAFEALSQYTREQNTRLVLIYFPDYIEVFGDNPPQHLSQTLSAKAQALGVPFLDLRPMFFKAREDGEIIHMAPLDFHLNPKGNRILAETVANFLVQEGLVTTTSTKS